MSADPETMEKIAMDMDDQAELLRIKSDNARLGGKTDRAVTLNDQAVSFDRAAKIIRDDAGRWHPPSRDETYLVWSLEHRGWWRAGGSYTPRLSEAGRFSHRRALEIATNAMPGTAHRESWLPELPVRLADIEAMRTDYKAKYPDIGPEPWE